MAYLIPAYGTLLLGLILQALAKPKNRAFIGFITCAISGLMVLILAYFVIKDGNLNSDVFTSFNYISIRIRLTPQLAIAIGLAAIMSVLTSAWWLIKSMKKSWIIPLATFFVYFCIGIDSIITAFISFILLCLSIRLAFFIKNK